MEALKLYWLGHPQVELKGCPIKLETRKATAMLAYLSLSSNECSREILATMFWPGGNQQKALANLRRTLSSLNSSLPGWIEANRETISLKKGAKLWVDIAAFRQLLSHLKGHDHTPTEVCDECLAVLIKEVELYRADFLEGLNLTNSPNFDEWQFFQRDSLRQEFAAMLERLSRGYLQRSEWDPAIHYARRRLTLDQLHEPAWRSLIDLYARSGQRATALHQYEELVHVLGDQVGQEPEPETRQLYERIRERPEAQQIELSAEVTSSLPLLKTKLYIPTLPACRVVRSSLVDRLNAIEENNLTLISAPAGFGKTTLLAEWITRTCLPIAWLSLDNGDNDEYRFLSYLIAALESIQDGVGREAQQIMRSHQQMPAYIILASLINDLGNVVEPYGLVLDDYQFITEHSVHETVAYLLDHVPAGMHIVIVTRADPPLQLGRLRAHGQMLELRTQDLRFHPDEVTEFLNTVMKLGLSDKDIQTLEERTEGWAAGLKMAALSILGRSDISSFLQAFSGTNRYVLDYLVEQVLKQQPAHIQSFLLRTSILERLSGPLCEALMTEQWMQSGETGQSVLEYLDRNNLFLISMDEERKWFRFHHLFADLLQSRFRQGYPELEISSHLQAAKWFASNSYQIEAVDHAIAAKDYTLAAEFIEKFALSLIARNEMVTILRWINLIPREVVQNRPRLIIYHAWVLARLGNFDNLEQMLQEAESILSVTSPPASLVELRSFLVHLHAYIANIKGDADLAIQVAFNASEQPKPTNRNSTDLNYLIGFQLGYAYYSKGDLETAERTFQSVAKSAEIAEDLYNMIVAQVELAGIQVLRGKLLQAEHIYDYAHQWLAGKVQNPATLEGILKVSRASILLEKNKLLESSQLIREGLGEAELGVRTNTIAYGYVILANILRAQGKLLQARKALEKATIQIQQRRTYPRTVQNVRTCQVDQWLAEGNLTDAQKWALEEFQTLDDPVPFDRESEYVALARVFLASRRFEEASDLLEKMAQTAELGRREGRLIKINILLALALDGFGQTGQALKVLRESLLKAEAEGYFRSFLDEGPQLKHLLHCGKQDNTWKEPTLRVYVDSLLASFGE